MLHIMNRKIRGRKGARDGLERESVPAFLMLPCMAKHRGRQMDCGEWKDKREERKERE